MKTINKCRVCGSNKLRLFFDLSKQPLANALLDSFDQKEKVYPLSWSYCLDCSLIQLNQTIDPKEMFSNYVWVTGTAQTTKDYAQLFCEEVLKRIDLQSSDYIFELASNDGTFLKPFIDRHYLVLGIDPAENIALAATKQGIPTLPIFFNYQQAKRLKKRTGQPKVIIARNVFYHLANLHSFTKGMEIILKPDGLIVVEFHYAKEVLQHLHFDSFYHEHVCFYTIKSLEKLLHQYNLYIEDLMVSPINAGNLVAFIRKGKIKEKKIVQKYRQQERKLQINTLKSWQDFTKRVISHREQLLKVLQDKNIVGYGASAKSSTLLNFCQINLPMIADDNPLKQGKYTAGTHIPIKSSQEVLKTKPDYILITAWNFADSIMKMVKEKYHYQGKFIIPLPKIKII